MPGLVTTQNEKQWLRGILDVCFLIYELFQVFGFKDPGPLIVIPALTLLQGASKITFIWGMEVTFD